MTKQSEVQEPTQLDETLNSLKRLVDYDLQALPRTEELGKTFTFSNAVPPSRDVIKIFERIPQQHLSELPEKELQLIEDTANSFYNLLEKIEEFNPEGNTTDERDQIVVQIENQHQPIFTKLFPLISYLTVRITDFSTLERDARAAVQKAKDEARIASVEIAEKAKEAQDVMVKINEIAKKQGVSQQAIHFKNEADIHDARAKVWLRFTSLAAVLLVLFAIGGFFIHRLPLLSPGDTYAAVQLGISKFILFGVLGYILVLCSRNFLSHKHNVIINRHKQISLVTFEALAKATTIDTKQDIILDRASDAIFSIPESGFSKNPNQSPSVGNSIIRVLPRVTGEGAG